MITCFLTKRKKQQEAISAVAYLLLKEWQSLLNAAEKVLVFGMSEAEADLLTEEKVNYIWINFQMALLGILTYIVAGLGRPEIATSMVDSYVYKLYANYPPNIVPNKGPLRVVEDSINSHYQKAREISDSYMRQGKTLEDINHALATSLFIWIGTKANENDIAFIENALNIFYKETKEKFEIR